MVANVGHSQVKERVFLHRKTTAKSKLIDFGGEGAGLLPDLGENERTHNITP